MRIDYIAFLLGDTMAKIVQNYPHPTLLMLKERVETATGWEKLVCDRSRT
jgi:hypothetical protein